MSTTAGYYVTTNGYDALVIGSNTHGWRMHQIGDAATFRDALLIGDEQDLDNWSGTPLDDGVQPKNCGDVLFVNDGQRINVWDAERLERRREFFAEMPRTKAARWWCSGYPVVEAETPEEAVAAFASIRAERRGPAVIRQKVMRTGAARGGDNFEFEVLTEYEVSEREQRDLGPGHTHIERAHLYISRV